MYGRVQLRTDMADMAELPPCPGVRTYGAGPYIYEFDILSQSLGFYYADTRIPQYSSMLMVEACRGTIRLTITIYIVDYLPCSFCFPLACYLPDSTVYGLFRRLLLEKKNPTSLRYHTRSLRGERRNL